MGGKLIARRVASRLRRLLGAERGADRRAFRCNCCGERNVVPRERFGRETPSCAACGSTVRMRSVVHALTTELFGRCTALPDLPRRPELRGVGLSDWPGYARPLAERLGYRNTFLHQEPHLDVTAPPAELLGALDFVIATDVFEHVTPLVQRAFDGARALLGADGVFVFSVPYALEGRTREHFPELCDWRIVEEDGRHVLLNTTADGRAQRFEDLVFHGGPGTTLELRVFSRDDLLAHLDAAGFARPTVHDADCAACGMLHDVDWSLTWSARPRR
ncbi:MAG: class I SAM-dependent methyltransferase [Planctomycetes bacterium]|nr:class I SAM-dependent methyltransferase [Planctomycetota bacterium]